MFFPEISENHLTGVEMFKGKGQRIIQSDDNNSHDPLF
jgi:hypothetical protein